MLNLLQRKAFLFIPIFLIFVACQTGQKENSGKEIVLQLKSGDENPRNSEGDFIRLKNGNIIFVYTKFTSGAGDHAKAHLVSRISGDNGKKWSSEDVEVVANEGDMNVMSVSLLRLRNNQIALFYLRKNSINDCIPVMRISEDEAQSWSAPHPCIDTTAYFVLNNDRVIQLNNGRIILPVAMHPTKGDKMDEKAEIMCYYSDDNGKSWHKSNSVENKGNITLQEPGVCELNNGSLFMYCRTDKGVQYFSWSKDRGENWSHIQPGNIKSPRSPASIKRIPQTGDLLLVWNESDIDENGRGKRTPFNLAISKDEGKNWIEKKTIENDPDGWYCYTAIDFTEDAVLLGHCAGNRKMHNGLETTHVTRLNLPWIYGTTLK